jgi:hypothetical protein
MVVPAIALLTCLQTGTIVDWSKDQILTLVQQSKFKTEPWTIENKSRLWSLVATREGSLKIQAELDGYKKPSVSEANLDFRNRIALSGREIWMRRGLQWKVAVLDYSQKSRSGSTEVSTWVESRTLRGRIRISSLMKRGFVERDRQDAVQLAKFVAEVLAVRFGSQ